MEKEPESWYSLKGIDTIDSPSLVVYLDRVKENISILKGMIDDPKRLRPHVKTHKSIGATQIMLEAGIEKFKCATIAEAEMLAQAGAEDVLLAYQPIGPKAFRFISLIKKYPATRFSCLIDNIHAAEAIAAIASESMLTVPVFLDLNVGMNRTGISPGNDALELFVKSNELSGIKLIGLHVYDGHIRNTDLQERTRECDKAFAPVLELKKKLEEKGFKNLLIIAGGTPTFPIHAKREEVECSPGTFIYWDKGYQTILPEQKFLIAALVVTRVISLPDATKVCLDLGHKSIASENDLNHRVFFINAPDLKMVGQSEEHLIAAAAGHHYKIGDVLYGIPYHICPTCALYERGLVAEGGEIVGEWKTVARDRKIEV